MATLFDKLKVGDIEIKNRIVLAPMTRSRATEDGVPLGIVAEYYAQRASGGLLISEATNISPVAKGYILTPGIFTEDQISGWRKVTDAVHAKDGKIFLQLWHTGRVATPESLPKGQLPVAPSPVKANGKTFSGDEYSVPHELTIDEIKQTVKDYATAAKNAINAGFDGVEIHGANGYLVHQFLGTNTNLRSDEYGGSDENRARFLFEVVDAVIEAVGAGRTAIRLSPRVTFNDMQDANAEELYPYIVRELNKRNLAYLHIGFAAPVEDQDGWHTKLHSIYQGVYIANGGFDKESGAKTLAENKADAIAYGKLYISNPDLVERFESNAELNEIDRSTMYGGGEKGFTDYPALTQKAAA